MRLSTSCLCALLLTLGAGSQALAQDLWPDLSDPPSADKPGENDAALIIGIEDYVAVPDVAGARQNASDWYVWLTKHRQVPTQNVKLLLNNYGTLEKMRAGAREAASQVQPGGTLWVIFIGHGAPASDGKDGVLVGYDAQQDPESLYARSLKRQELLELVSRGKQQQTVVLLDACFSGRTGQGQALAKGLQPLLPVQEEQTPSSTILMSAGTSDQFAGPLPGADRPAFSYLMLGALHGWADKNGDQAVSVQEAMDYTRGAMATLVQGRQQTPQVSAQAMDLPLSQGASAQGPDLAQVVLATRGGDTVQVRPPGGGTGASVTQKASRRPTLFGGPDALNLGVQVGVGYGSSNSNGDTASGTNETISGESVFQGNLALQLFSQSTWLEWGLRLGYVYATDSGYARLFEDSKDTSSGFLMGGSFGLNLLTWPNAQAVETSLVNLSGGLEVQLAPARNSPWAPAVYLANTSYLDCLWFGRAELSYIPISSAFLPAISLLASVGIQTGRDQACHQ